ncbi:hypothetical protein B0H13DRAFT_2354779 [Mycena leptocephala]|nr:hypothetical protein B0H13DRAFT_2354779 [Mycena leptocephala]
MAIRWRREPDLEVSVWCWDKFRELRLGDFDTFAAVASVYDLVFGGADLTVEGAGREFENDEDERAYMDRLTQLDGMTAVFPNPTTSWAARFKSNVITDLDTIAREITNSERPVTRLLRSADEYTENVVLKREASARSQHRHFFDGPSQELNPVLRKCGELRAFVVLKQVIGVVATTPTDEEEFSEAMEKNGYGLKVMRRVGGTRVRRDHAQQQLEAFTLATLAALIQKDEQRYARESDLAYLARLDVTYFEKDVVWSFCVNEVERPLMDLFSRTDVAERVMDELGVAMRRPEPVFDPIGSIQLMRRAYLRTTSRHAWAHSADDLRALPASPVPLSLSAGEAHAHVNRGGEGQEPGMRVNTSISFVDKVAAYRARADSLGPTPISSNAPQTAVTPLSEYTHREKAVETTFGEDQTKALAKF